MTYKQLARLASEYRLILGSGSPRRFELLTDCGVPFTRLTPDLHESRLPGESPFQFAQRLADDKALEVARRAPTGAVVIGCDTVVVLGDDVLGKPVSTEGAVGMLLRLSGQTHVVCTALSLVWKSAVISHGYDTTQVRFHALDERAVREYVATGEPMDKAGAYGIQGMGGFLVDTLEGNLDTVVGFPRNLLEELAGKALEHLAYLQRTRHG